MIGCNQKKDTFSYYDKNHLDSLFSIIEDDRIDSKQKLKIANSIEVTIENQKNIDTILLKQYHKLAYFYDQEGNLEKCNSIYFDLIEKAEKINNNKYIAIGNYNLGNYYYDVTKYDSAYFYFNKAEKSAVNLNNLWIYAKVLNVKSSILLYKKDYVLSEVYSIKALRIAKKNEFYDILYNNYLTLGNSQFGLNNYKKAVEYLEKAIDVSNYLTNEYDYLYLKAQPYNHIVRVHIKLNDYKKAISIANRALQFDDYKKTDPIIYCYLKQNLAYSKYKLGDKTQWKEFEKLLKIGDSIDNIPIQMVNNAHLAEYYFDQKEFDKAKMHALAAKQMGHQTHFFDDELAALDLLAKIEPLKAKYYLERRIELSDSLQTVERISRDKFARIEYETEEIATEKSRVEAKHQLLVRRFWIIFGFSVLLLLIFLLWFKIQKQKIKNKELLLIQENQKANEEVYQLMLDQQQQIEKGKQLEKQRVSMELHDGVMGRLTAVRMNLFPLIMTEKSDKTDKFLAQLDGIQDVEKEIRAISHELNATVFNQNSNFVSVINQLFQEIEHHAHLHFDLQISDDIPWDLMDTSLKINLYRILQEALQNIAKYAEAKKVTLNMFYKENQLYLEIMDDGKGFDTSLKRTGIGLKNMQTRVDFLKGQFSIDSKPGKGVKIILLIPI